MSSDVFLASVRAKRGDSLLEKVEKLFDQVGFNAIVQSKDLVAIKLHFGEKGNTAYIRPQFIRRIVNKVKAQGGKPFLTDSNTLYVGSRSNAVDHLQTAIENGFAYAVVDAPLIIADGLSGQDFERVEINLKHFKDVKISSVGVHADALIAVSHFKGHAATGFGGTIKNLGMGLGSRSGKQMMHSDVLPKVNQNKCLGCGKCTKYCPENTITMEEGKALIIEGKCIGCGECTAICPVYAVDINWKTDADTIQEKMVEYVYGVLKNKQGKAGFINFVTDVSPDCDCCGWNDAPVVGDIGILASTDPIALDQACADLVNQAQPLKESLLGSQSSETDKFRALYPAVDWTIQLAYGEKIGLGSRKYNLRKI